MEYSSLDSVSNGIFNGRDFVVLLAAKNYPFYEEDAVQTIKDSLTDMGMDELPILKVDSEEIRYREALIFMPSNTFQTIAAMSF